MSSVFELQMLLSKAKNLLQEGAKERTAASVPTGGRAWIVEVMFAVEILMVGQAVVVPAPLLRLSSIAAASLLGALAPKVDAAEPWLFNAFHIDERQMWMPQYGIDRMQGYHEAD